MKKWHKIGLSVLGAAVIFAAGVHYAPVVNAYIGKWKGAEEKEKTLNDLVKKLSSDLMKWEGVYGIGVIGQDHVEIRVADENTKGQIQKYIQKYGYSNQPIQIVIGQQTIAQN